MKKILILAMLLCGVGIQAMNAGGHEERYPDYYQSLLAGLPFGGLQVSQVSWKLDSSGEVALYVRGKTCSFAEEIKHRAENMLPLLTDKEYESDSNSGCAVGAAPMARSRATVKVDDAFHGSVQS